MQQHMSWIRGEKGKLTVSKSIFPLVYKLPMAMSSSHKSAFRADLFLEKTVVETCHYLFFDPFPSAMQQNHNRYECHHVGKQKTFALGVEGHCKIFIDL